MSRNSSRSGPCVRKAERPSGGEQDEDEGVHLSAIVTRTARLLHQPADSHGGRLRSAIAYTAVRILHQDAHVLAIDKPAGMLHCSGRGRAEAPALSALVREVAPEALPVHRLDRDTSGVVLFAVTRQAHRALNAAFESRRARRRTSRSCASTWPRRNASMFRWRRCAEGVSARRKGAPSPPRPRSRRKNDSAPTRSARASRARAAGTRSAPTWPPPGTRSPSIPATERRGRSASRSLVGGARSGHHRPRPYAAARSCAADPASVRARLALGGVALAGRHGALPGSAPGARRSGRRRTSPVACEALEQARPPGTTFVHQRLHVGLEGDLDLVPADLLHQSDPEQRVLDHLLGGVLVPRRVAPARARSFPASSASQLVTDGLAARRSRTSRGSHDPFRVPSRHRRGSCARPGRCCTDPHRPAGDHREDGVTQVHLATRAPRVDVGADLRGSHGVAQLRSQRGAGARRFA